MKIAIGNDHGGLILKQEIVSYLKESGIEVIDCGIDRYEAVDYPDYADLVAEQVLSGGAQYGIVICGTGIGISISANKIKGIRCALCTDSYMAKMARMHNDANMLALGGRVLGSGLAIDIVVGFINAGFSTDPRHTKRVNKIMALEK